MIWFTSDTHFGTERTLKLSRRPFDSVLEMDRTLVDNWNKTVAPNDTVYHLGDFGDYSVAHYLNGNITMVPGNYERHYSSEVRKYKDAFEEVLICDIYRATIGYEIDGYSLELILNMAHEPHLIKDEPISDNRINLFGHVHHLSMVKRYGLNVGTDCHNFYPINLDTILHYHKAILYYYDEDVFS